MIQTEGSNPSTDAPKVESYGTTIGGSWLNMKSYRVDWDKVDSLAEVICILKAMDVKVWTSDLESPHPDLAPYLIKEDSEEEAQP